jgi:hypothetical protein
LIYANPFRERKKEAGRWEKIKILNSIKTKTAALDIVKELPNGQNMRDLMRKTSLVMMAEPEEFVETEKAKNRVRSKGTGECDTNYHFEPIILLGLPHFTGQDHASD